MKLLFTTLALVAGASLVQAHSGGQSTEFVAFDDEPNLCDYSECLKAGYSHHECRLKEMDCRDKN